MRPVVMPDEWFPGGERQTIGGESDTEPAEYVIEPDDVFGVKMTTLIQFDPDEIQQFQESGYMLLTLFGGELPWILAVAPMPPTSTNGEANES